MLIKIAGEQVSKIFDRNIVFKNISFSIDTPASLAVTGNNGTGKSTLLEIIAGIQKPSAGRMQYTIDGKEVDSVAIQDNIGFSGSKINPYGELTVLENIWFVSRYITNNDKNHHNEYLRQLLNKFDLLNEREKQTKYLSSGMKQRLRLLLAILNDPHILILDEPGSNLDAHGKDIIYEHIESVKHQKIIIVATNRNEEARICDVKINLGREYN